MPNIKQNVKYLPNLLHALKSALRLREKCDSKLRSNVRSIKRWPALITGKAIGHLWMIRLSFGFLTISALRK